LPLRTGASNTKKRSGAQAGDVILQQIEDRPALGIERYNFAVDKSALP